MCAQPATPQEGLKRSDAVFLGLVERFEIKGTKRVATVRVKTVWKGSVTSRVRVTTGHDDGDCGFHFIAGLEYVIYATRGAFNALETNMCSRTIHASGEAAEDLKALGPGTSIATR